MQATVQISEQLLKDCDITTEDFEETVRDALSKLNHPVTGDPLYFNAVQVTITQEDA